MQGGSELRDSAGPAEEVVNEIKALGNGADAIAIKANIGDVGEIRSLFGEAEEKLGPVNICVNNAGITNDMLVMMMKPEDFTNVVDVNLNGVFYASQAAFASMMPKKIGRIINVTSIVGQIGSFNANYGCQGRCHWHDENHGQDLVDVVSLSTLCALVSLHLI